MHSVSFPGDTKSSGLGLFQSGAGTALGYLTAPQCLQGENQGGRDGKKDETEAGTGKLQMTRIIITWIAKRWSILPSAAASYLWRLICPQGMKPCASPSESGIGLAWFRGSHLRHPKDPSNLCGPGILSRKQRI